MLDEIIYVLDNNLFRTDSRGNPFQVWTSDKQFLTGIDKDDWINADIEKKYVVDDRSEGLDSIENEFRCPSCGKYETGYPDACNNCETEYKW